MSLNRTDTNPLRRVCVLLLAGCVDYTPSGEKPGAGVESDATAVETNTSEQVELCDGIDNDGDGTVDEGFPDTDGDGVMDCRDDTCEVALGGSLAVAEGSTCPIDRPAPAEPWNVEVAWDYTASEVVDLIRVADLDRDGVAEVLTIGHQPDAGLTVLSGLDGSTLWTSTAVGAGSQLAVADVDGDGELDIVGFNGEGGLTALDHDGAVFWTNTDVSPPNPQSTSSYGLDVQVADIGADGRVEVIVRAGVVQGSDGSTVNLLDSSEPGQTAYFERDIAIGDLDQAGVLDVVSSWRRFRADGTLVWDRTPPPPWGDVSDPSLVQADADNAAELVWVAETTVQVMDTDGSLLFEHPTADDDARSYTLACAGDLDGDGAMEFVFNDVTTIHAWRLDGTELWTAPSHDATEFWVACTTFDFDRDGRKEVVYSDGQELAIYDGPTGRKRFVDSDWTSNTAGDQKVVADLDGDGSAELLSLNPAGAGYDSVTLRVYRNVNRDWPPAGQLWATSNWAGTSVYANGHVPRTAAPSWLTTKVWRGQPELPLRGHDLRPVVSDSCVASCATGPVNVALRVENLGPEEADANTPVAVYVVETDGARRLLQVATIPDWIDDGTTSPDVLLSLPVDAALAGLEFVAGDDGSGSSVPDDCDPANNTLTWVLPPCQ